VLASCASLTPSALAVEALPLTSISPPNGVTVSAANPVPVEVVSAARNLPELTFGLSSRSAHEPDGELGTQFPVGFLESGPGIYRLEEVSMPFFAGLLKPGKYYWQVRSGGSIAPLRLSPVFWFIVAPGEPQLTLTWNSPAFVDT
jgi:hypothetical protein